MTKKSIVLMGAMLAGMFASADIALAQGYGYGRGGGMGAGPVAVACEREIARYCSYARHGGGEVRRCLEMKRYKVSRTCRAALDGTGFGRRWR